MAVQGDQIVVAGFPHQGATGPDFAVARLNDNGSLDDGSVHDSTSADFFGTGGKQTIDFGSPDDYG